MRRSFVNALLAILAVFNLAAFTGCPGSKTEKCSWGAVCPPGEVCHDPTQQCVLPGQISACRDKNDYDSCNYTGSTPGTVCRNTICIIPHCGDSIADLDEDCDGADLGGETCESLGLGEGTLGCNTDCTFDTSGCESGSVCGNNIREGSEACDGEDLGQETCQTRGYYAGTLACLSDCSDYDVSGCGGYCGDGSINGDEVCDGLSLGGKTCETEGYYPGVLACVSDCSGFDFSGCGGICGDGEVNGDELCDGEDLGEESCESQGYYPGALACLSDCNGFDTSGCWNWQLISGGLFHTCAVKSNKTAWCWGWNESGQLGDGTNEDKYIPVQVDVSDDVDDISGGESHTCAVRNNGTAWCWGYNWYGQLGDGTETNKNTPVEI